MQARTFNAWMPSVNHQWAARVLNMEVSPDEHRGADLIDDTKIVEVKLKLIAPHNYTHIHWTTYEHQKEYQNGKPGFWGVGTYVLREPVEEIETVDPKELEALVVKRELWLAPWDWIDQFPFYTQKARRNCRWYESKRCYAKQAKLPPVTESWRVNKGKIHFTQGVDISLFTINGKKI